MRITFLVPGRGLVGGIKVMGEYAGRLRARGHEVRVLYKRPARNLKRLVQWLARRRVPDALDESGCPLAGVGAFTPASVPDGDVLVVTGLRTVLAAADLPPEKGRLVDLVQGTIHLEESPEEAREAMAVPARRVAVSQHVARCLAERFGVEAAVVPNGVDHRRFYPAEPPRPPGRTIGMIYAPGPAKGTDEGFEAVARVRDRLPDARLVVFGATRPRRVPPRTEVFVRPKTSRLRTIYAGCDVWLAPSHSEGFGLPVLEAMACRVVPVATQAGGHEELIEDQVSGFLVPVGDVETMARRAAMVLDDETLSRRMADAAHLRSLAFDWETSTDRLEALLREWAEA